MNRRWLPEEEEYLQERWGSSSIPSIAKKLGRSENAIIIRAQRLGLGAFLMGGDYITLNQLHIELTGRDVNAYNLTSWIKNRGMPVRMKRVGQCSFRIVYLEEFWKWAEEHRSFIDFSKLEPLALGEEPEWVEEQRKKDFVACSLQRKDPWTKVDDERLIRLLKKQKYSYSDLSKMLQRTEGAIQRRCTDLKIKDRPVKKDTHGAESVWTQWHYDRLEEGIKNGDSYALIGSVINKSEKAVRGKVYVTYLTESADKVRKILGTGHWGDNAPEPALKQALYLSGHRAGAKDGVARLISLLKYRMNQLGYDPYWQRHMCMNWDDYEGCSAGSDNCDSCTSFRRIKPQYCARCGKTFYERVESRFCGACRTARKKKAQRKWCMNQRRDQGGKA